MALIERTLNRRELLWSSAVLSAGLVVGCSEKVSNPSVLENENTFDFNNFEISIDLLRDRMLVVANDFAATFRVNVNPQEIVTQINLITSKEEFDGLDSKRDGVDGQLDYKSKLFFILDSRLEADKRIQINKIALDTGIENNKEKYLNQNDYQDLIDYTLGFALADYLNSSYYSEEFKALAQESINQGTDVQSVFVDGAVLKVESPNRKSVEFQYIEYMESFLINTYLYVNILRHQDIPLEIFSKITKPRLELYIDLLKKTFMGTNATNLIEELYTLRNEVGGREKYYKMIQKSAGKGFDKVNDFTRSILGIVEAGDRKEYEKYMGPLFT